MDDLVQANLYLAAKDIKKDFCSMNVKERSSYKHNTLKVLKESSPSLNSESTLITKSGDWGIKCSNSLDPITGEMCYYYRIEDATRGGVFIPIEIDSIKNGVKRWYTTNLYQNLGENVYPLPLTHKSGDDFDFPEGVVKNKFCYANFSMTCPYRIRVAEWVVSTNQDINYYFPERYSGQKVELDMPFMESHRLSVRDFLTELASHKFAICPMGNGLDTYRTWESIAVDTVPIVQDSWMSRVFSKIWPMIIVKRYELTNITTLMNAFYEKYGEIVYDKSLLEERNIKDLLDRIEYESNRIRRSGV